MEQEFLSTHAQSVMTSVPMPSQEEKIHESRASFFFFPFPFFGSDQLAKTRLSFDDRFSKIKLVSALPRFETTRKAI